MNTRQSGDYFDVMKWFEVNRNWDTHSSSKIVGKIKYMMGLPLKDSDKMNETYLMSITMEKQRIY